MSYRPTLAGVDESVQDYFVLNQIPEIVESLLASVLVARPEDPWTYVQEKLEWLQTSDDFEGTYAWDMFIDDELRPPKRTFNVRSYMDSLMGYDEEMSEEYEKACNLHVRLLLRRVIRGWRRWTIAHQEKRVLLHQRMDEARDWHRLYAQRVHFAKWCLWLRRYAGRLHTFSASLTAVANVSTERFVFRAWHKYTQEAVRTTRWFQACEGDDDENVGDGTGQSTALRPPGCDDVSLLPRVLAVKVFSYLTVPELANCSRSCRSWKVIVQQTGLWSRVDLSTCAQKVSDAALMKILNRCRPFLVHLNVRSCDQLTPRGLSAIGGCTNLQDLNMSECGEALTAESLQKIVAGCRSLLYLNISYCHVTDACLRVLSRHCPNLQHLSLAGCVSFTSRGVRHLSSGNGCHKVTYLDLSDCVQLTTEATWAIGKACPQLNTLVLNDMPQLDDDSLRALVTDLHNVKHISVMGCPNVSDGSLKFLMKQAAQRLISFKIENNNLLTDSFVRSLARAASLRHLCLNSCVRLTDNSLRALSQCKYLVSLDLTNCLRVSDVGVRYIVEGAAGAQLRSINLTNCVRVSDVTLLRLAKTCQELRHAAFCFCEHVQDAGVEMLGDLPNLISLDLTGCKVADEGISALGTNPHFADLVLSECVAVTDNGLQKMCTFCPNLHLLDVSHCPTITDTAMKNLAFFCHLMTDVNLTGCSQLTDLTVQYLSSGCHFLHTLVLVGCSKVTEKSLKFLKRGCPVLRVLDLSGCKKITKGSIVRANMPPLLHIIKQSAPIIMSPAPSHPSTPRPTEQGERAGMVQV
ncbi:F-box and leucine-rich repeat protein 13-like [Sycon ciliatum]|uniref:F-box and leucine-rich repeat protein 13-like n=1 Tax=Sycon ciliatum TaxID=27933 RepID=UPI0031F6AEBE